MAVRINKTDYSALVAQARNGSPQEVCGLIAGQLQDGDRIIKKIYPLTNVDASAEHFSLEPREQLAAVRDMRARALSPLGNYHSHPATPARPSAEDIRLAFDPGATYLILSLAGAEPALKAFRIESGEVREEVLMVDEHL